MDIDLAGLVVQAGASGGAVWVVVRLQLAHLAEKIKDVKGESDRAHARIDDLLKQRAAPHD